VGIELCGVYRTTTLTVLRGQFPLNIWIFVDFWRGISSRGGGSGVYGFEEYIVFVQF